MAVEYEAAFKMGEGTLRLTFDRADRAADKVEESGGSGSVIKWKVEPNLPGLWPERVHRCLGQWVYDDGKWYVVDVYGAGHRIGEERPGSGHVS